jgi:chromosome segregation ATPase
LDLDILIAARTAPGHSWVNPAERIMSLLNLAYQNVALYRSEMSSHNEQVLKSCGSMSDIRKKAEKEADLKKSWLKAVEPMINLLDERTERIQLKQKSFKRGVPATDEEISDFELNVRRLVDPDITVGKYTKNDLKNNDGYKEFMNKHCRERNYIFQVNISQHLY